MDRKFLKISTLILTRKYLGRCTIPIYVSYKWALTYINILYASNESIPDYAKQTDEIRTIP